VLPFLVEVELKDETELNDSLRGGRGGALDCFGGDSRLMRMPAGELRWTPLSPSTVSRNRGSAGPSPFNFPVRDGPSSTTQSLRSINEVFLSKIVGEGDGEPETG
jgi:hypothetical protein